MPQTRQVRSYCRTCLAACGVLKELREGRVLKLRGDPDHPLSRATPVPRDEPWASFTSIRSASMSPGCVARVISSPRRGWSCWVT